MRLIFLVAGIDAVRLLGAMRAENKVLRDAALERTNHLASIRSSVLLTHTYLGDYFLDSNQRNPAQISGESAGCAVARRFRSGELPREHSGRADLS